MTAEQFAYWLQGFMEVGQPRELNHDQIQVIKDHLKLVFEKKTPERSTEPVIVPKVVPTTTQPYTDPDWTWRPNPYTVTCTGNDLNDPNKKIC